MFIYHQMVKIWYYEFTMEYLVKTFYLGFFLKYIFFSFLFKARTQSSTTTNYAVKFPTFGEIAGVSTSGVQWISLALGKPPS